MNILITGGTGLIGRNLLKRLGKKNTILVIARDKYQLNDLKKEFPNIDIEAGDISDESWVRSILGNVDIVYHLAALRAVGLAERNVAGCIDTNIVGTVNLLKHFDGKKFVTLSTDKAVKINSTYGASKFIIEKLVSEYARNTGKIYQIIRCGNVFGSTDSVMSIWKHRLQNKHTIKITDPDATRYFCTTDQVIDAMLHNKLPYEKVVYCLKLKSTSLRNLLRAMQIKYGKAVDVDIIGRQRGENKHEKLFEGDKGSNKAKRYTVNELLKLI